MADCIIQILLAHGVLFSQGLDARQISFCGRSSGILLAHLSLCLLKRSLGLIQSAFGLAQHGLCLIESCLVFTRIDLEKYLAFPNEIAFLVVLLDEIALDLRADGSVDETVECSYPFSVDRHVFLSDVGDLDDRCLRFNLLLLSAPRKSECQRKNKQKRTELQPPTYKSYLSFHVTPF